MKKLRIDQLGFSVIEVVSMIVILGLIGSTGRYLWHTRENTSPSHAQAKSTLTKKVSVKQLPAAEEAATLPLGWMWLNVSVLGIKFAYPTVYGSFTSSSELSQSGDAPAQQALISKTPSTAPFAGVNGAISVEKYATSSAVIQSRKYGPTVRFSNDKWIVVADNPGDATPYKAGAAYNEATSSTTTSGITVYKFTSGDEGAIVCTYATIDNGHLYTIQLPEFDTGSYASTSHLNDQKPYDLLANQLAATITSAQTD